MAKIKILQLKPPDREKYPNLFSLNQLRKKGLRPKPNVKPRAIVIRHYSKTYRSYYLYDINLTQPNKMTEKEKRANKKYRKELAIKKEKKKREDEVQRREDLRYSEYTAWQLLQHWHRVPLDNVNPHYHCYYDNEWGYYYLKDTRKVNAEEFDKLKALYIQKFGGWEHIDLRNTTYNGAKWW